MPNNANLISIFFTGLLSGGLACLAVQGGLLAAAMAQREDERLKDRVKKGSAAPILFFLAAKLAAHAVLGILLGWFGSLFRLSIGAQVLMQSFVLIFMVGTALALLEVHPFFRYFIIQPPKFLTRRIRGVARSGDIFAPALLGAFTVFIPCGTTQAMMALAVASGSPIYGSLILSAFVLGTSPLFFILGYFAGRLGDFWQQKFSKTAAFAVILIALFNFNNLLLLGGSSENLSSLARSAWCGLSYCENDNSNFFGPAPSPGNRQTIVIDNNGYSPREFTVQAGADVKITLVNSGGYSCAQIFTIPSLNIQKSVAVGSSEVVEFRAPSAETIIPFMCSMGMYRGNIYVKKI